MAIKLLLLFLISGLFTGTALPVLPDFFWVVIAFSFALLLLLIYVFAWWQARKPWYALLWLSCFCMGLVWSMAYGHRLFAHRLPDHLASADFLVEGVVVNLPEPTERGERFDLVIERLVQTPPGYDQTHLLQKLRLNSYESSLDTAFTYQPGQRWRLMVRLKPPRGFLNPWGFDYEGWLLQQGYSAVGYVRASPENQLLPDQSLYFDSLKSILLNTKVVFDRWGFASLMWIDIRVNDINQRALFAAIALGYKEEFTRQHWDLLKNTGTIHLVVVSGLNIVLAASAGYFLFGWLARLLYFPLHLLSAPVWGAVGAILLATFYAGMTGFSLPTQRSLVMVLCGLMIFLLRRHLAVSTGFLLALTVVLLLDPFAAFTSSLWLSFGAVAVLLYGFSSRLIIIPSIQKQNRFCHLWFWIHQWLRTQFYVSLGIFPFLAYWMGSVPLIMPLANLFAVPFATFVLLPLTIISFVTDSISPTIGGLVLQLAGYGMNLFWWFLEIVEPFNVNWTMTVGRVNRGDVSSVVALCFAIAGVVVMLAPRGLLPRFYGVLLLLPLLIPMQHKLPDGEFELTMIDVGQGLSVMVETSNAVTIYDVGDRYSDQFDIGRDVVAQIVQRYGHKKIDTLIISHSDSDHAGGLTGLLDVMAARQILSGSSDVLQERLDNRVQFDACLRGQQWITDGVVFEVMSPLNSAAIGKPNNQSCVIRVSSRNFSVLLTGDIERKQEEWLLQHSRDSLKADVLVIPHHGSKSSSTYDFVQSVQPDLAIVSVGYKSQHGHPHPAVMSRYRELGIPVWRTDLLGAITLRSLDKLPYSKVASKPVAARLSETGYWHRW